MTKEEIKVAALRLGAAEREALAEELLLSIGDEDRDGIDAAWLNVARQRDETFRRGETSARPVDEVIERLSRKARP